MSAEGTFQPPFTLAAFDQLMEKLAPEGKSKLPQRSYFEDHWGFNNTKGYNMLKGVQKITDAAAQKTLAQMAQYGINPNSAEGESARRTPRSTDGVTAAKAVPVSTAPTPEFVAQLSETLGSIPEPVKDAETMRAYLWTAIPEDDRPQHARAIVTAALANEEMLAKLFGSISPEDQAAIAAQAGIPETHWRLREFMPTYDNMVTLASNAEARTPGKFSQWYTLGADEIINAAQVAAHEGQVATAEANVANAKAALEAAQKATYPDPKDGAKAVEDARQVLTQAELALEAVNAPPAEQPTEEQPTEEQPTRRQRAAA